MTRYLFFGITFAFAAAMQPGPLQAFLVSHTLSSGWRRTISASLSPLLSDGPVLLVVLLLLSRVPAYFIHILQLAGGMFLLYLGVRAVRTRSGGSSGAEPSGGGNHKALLRAAFINLLNPGPYLGWSLVMGPMLLNGWREDPVYGIALVAGFYVTMVVCLCATIMTVAAAGNIGERTNRVLITISSLGLGAIGLYQIWRGAGALLFER